MDLPLTIRLELPSFATIMTTRIGFILETLRYNELKHINLSMKTKTRNEAPSRKKTRFKNVHVFLSTLENPIEI